MFVLKILEKIKEPRLKFSQRSLKVLSKMVIYQETIIKLINIQLTKLKPAAKKTTKKNKGKMLRLTKKIFEDKELLHELFLTTRQKSKIGNLIANNMPRDTKFSKD